MNLFSWFSRGSAPIARERLQILLAHERNERDHPDLLGVLREEILALISRHVSFDPDKVQIKMERGKSVSTLAVDIEIPNAHGLPAAELSQSRRTRAKRSRSNATPTMGQKVA
jgi:cell division topological specificity factor